MPATIGNDELSNAEMNVYPNSAGEQLVIDATTNIKWLCYDSAGKLMSYGYADKQTIVDVSIFMAGIYFLHLVNEEGISTVQKVVIE